MGFYCVGVTGAIIGILESIIGIVAYSINLYYYFHNYENIDFKEDRNVFEEFFFVFYVIFMHRYPEDNLPAYYVNSLQFSELLYCYLFISVIWLIDSLIFLIILLKKSEFNATVVRFGFTAWALIAMALTILDLVLAVMITLDIINWARCYSSHRNDLVKEQCSRHNISIPLAIVATTLVLIISLRFLIFLFLNVVYIVLFFQFACDLGIHYPENIISYNEHSDSDIGRIQL